MNLITQNAASKLEYAPTKAYLSRLSKKPLRPGFFVNDEDRIYIDIEHPDWVALIQRRRVAKNVSTVQGGPGGLSKKRKAPKNTKPDMPNAFDDSDGVDLSKMTESQLAVRATMIKVEKSELEISKLRWEVMRKKIQVERETKDLIEFSFAEYYFFSYLDKVNSSMLRLVKKLRPQLENYCIEQDSEGMLKYLQEEIEITLREAKRQQKKGLEEMAEENTGA